MWVGVLEGEDRGVLQAARRGGFHQVPRPFLHDTVSGSSGRVGGVGSYGSVG